MRPPDRGGLSEALPLPGEHLPGSVQSIADLPNLQRPHHHGLPVVLGTEEPGPHRAGVQVRVHGPAKAVPEVRRGSAGSDAHLQRAGHHPELRSADVELRARRPDEPDPPGAGNFLQAKKGMFLRRGSAAKILHFL